MVARYFFKAIRHLFFRSHLSGAQNLTPGEPAILVANHAGSFGPVSVITSLPLRLYPWVAHEVTDRKLVSKRIQTEFLEQELHLRPPISTYLGRVVGRICVALMRDINAIPVYAKSKQIMGTVQASLALLEQGKSILVFAEDSTQKINDVLCEFRTGFVYLARQYYERTKKAVRILPVAVNKKVGRIRIGAPLRFDGDSPFSREKQRLKQVVQDTVYDLYLAMEAKG
jgi:1-acyl-sn-glycerol-3-phosphate acyltransferase